MDPGGSSSGSGAAVAAGLAYGAMGSDTGGSIHWSAFCCGIVGMKATYGRVGRAGVFPLSWSLDHTGPMTRTVKDCAIMLRACTGYDPRDPASANVPVPDFSATLGRDIKGIRIGIPRALCAGNCDAEILYTPLFSLTGFPALALPCGFSSSGLPIGFQLAGKPFDETTVFQVGYAYEQSTPWHTRHPAL